MPDAKLLVRKRLVKSLIALPDNNEKALTYALGYMLANSRLLRDRLLKKALGKTYSASKITVEVEKGDDKGENRYDVVLRIGHKLLLIIEGKIYRARAGPKQCYRYIERLSEEPENKRYANRKLVLVYDDVQEADMKEDLERLQGEVIELANKQLHLQRRWRKYWCMKGVTWWHIQEWATQCLRDADGSEKGLLRDYAHYLEIERYSHGFLTDLVGSRHFAKEQIQRIEHAVRRLEEVTTSEDNQGIELVPNKEDSGYHYMGGEEKTEGICEFRKGMERLFGLYFDYKDKFIKVYVHLPKRLSPRLKKAQSKLEKAGISVEWNEQYKEIEFDITKMPKRAITRLIREELQDFFREAIKGTQFSSV
jgi:hypothetical protein